MKTLNLIISNRWIQHLAFWIGSYALLIHLFAYKDVLAKSDWVYTGLFHMSLLFVVYINLWLHIPKLLSKRRFIPYLISAGFTIAAGAFLNDLVYRHLAEILFPDYYFYTAYSIIALIGIHASYLLLSTLFHLSKAWIVSQQTEKRQLATEKETKQSELSALHAQIQPHFMMNSLNNLYGLSLEQDERTPEMIMKLSQSMQYLLYRSQSKTVSLADEIDFLNQYIALEKLRSDTPEKIHYEWRGDWQTKQTAPLLMLPLIENAFKHGLKSTDEDVNIDIVGEIDDTSITLTVSNQISEHDSMVHTESGIGLENLKRRLDLLFPGNYEFKTIQTERLYTSQIKYPIS